MSKEMTIQELSDLMGQKADEIRDIMDYMRKQGIAMDITANTDTREQMDGKLRIFGFRFELKCTTKDGRTITTIYKD